MLDYMHHRCDGCMPSLKSRIVEGTLDRGQSKIPLRTQAQTGIRLDSDRAPAVRLEEIEEVTQAAADFYQKPAVREFLSENSPRASVISDLQGFLFRSPLVGGVSMFIYPVRVVISYQVNIRFPLTGICIQKSTAFAFDDSADLSHTRFKEHRILFATT